MILVSGRFQMSTEHQSKLNFWRAASDWELVAVHGACIRGKSTRLARRTRHGVVEGLSDVARLRTSRCCCRILLWIWAQAYSGKGVL